MERPRSFDAKRGDLEGITHPKMSAASMSEPLQRASESKSSPGELSSRREVDRPRGLEKLSGNDSRPPSPLHIVAIPRNRELCYIPEERKAFPC
jgi:hypothetical protein